jgi:hypothetical protein
MSNYDAIWDWNTDTLESLINTTNKEARKLKDTVENAKWDPTIFATLQQCWRQWKPWELTQHSTAINNTIKENNWTQQSWNISYQNTETWYILTFPAKKVNGHKFNISIEVSENNGLPVFTLIQWEQITFSPKQDETLSKFVAKTYTMNINYGDGNRALIDKVVPSLYKDIAGKQFLDYLKINELTIQPGPASSSIDNNGNLTITLMTAPSQTGLSNGEVYSIKKNIISIPLNNQTTQSSQYESSSVPIFPTTAHSWIRPKAPSEESKDYTEDELLALYAPFAKKSRKKSNEINITTENKEKWVLSQLKKDLWLNREWDIKLTSNKTKRMSEGWKTYVTITISAWDKFTEYLYYTCDCKDIMQLNILSAENPNLKAILDKVAGIWQ